MASVEHSDYSSGSDTEQYFDACETERAPLTQPDRPDCGLLNLEADLVNLMFQEARDHNNIPLSVSDIDQELAALEERERQRVEASSRFGVVMVAARKMLNAARRHHKELKVQNEDIKIALIKARNEANGYTAEELGHTTIKTEPTSLDPSVPEILEPSWLRGPTFENFRMKRRRQKENAKRDRLPSSTDRPELASQRRDRNRQRSIRRNQRTNSRERERSDVGRSHTNKRIRKDGHNDKKFLLKAFKKLKMEP